MYNELLNYFENNCCLANIFMKKHWLAWYVTLTFILGETIYFTNTYGNIKGIVVSTIIGIIILGSLMITFFKTIFAEIKQELKIEKLYIDWLSILKKEKFNPAYFEFQRVRMVKYCVKHNVTNNDITQIIKYVNEDLDEKYPKDNSFQIFTSVVVPATISIIAIYLTNNKIESMEAIIGIVIAYLIFALIVFYGIYSIRFVKYILVNRRRNLLELKDILRNIDIGEIEINLKNA